MSASRAPERPTLREARPTDVAALLGLMERLYAEDGLKPFHRDEQRRAVLELLASPEAGRIWAVDDDSSLVGYVAVTWGFSLEYGGRDAFIDELFITESHRGRGLAREALAAAEAACRQRGVHALHLEVERANVAALALYRRTGFVDHDRVLLTKQIERSSSKGRHDVVS